MRQGAKVGLLTAVATGSVLASTAGYAYAAEAHGGAANSPGVGSGNSVQAPVDLPVNACGNTVNVIGLLNPAYGNSCGNSSQSSDGSAGSGSSAGSGTSAGSGSSAHGGTANSPGAVSGNSVQAPVNAPVDACGNSVNVVGLGNPAFGNDCGNHQTVAPPPSTQPGDNCPPPECTGEGCGDTPPPPSQTPPGQTLPGGDTPPGATSGGDTGGSTGGDTGGTSGGGTRSGGGGSTPGVGTPVQQTGLTSPSVPVQPAGPASSVPVASVAPARAQLASTGAEGLEFLAPTGALLLIGGGVLYRRSRAMAG